LIVNIRWMKDFLKSVYAGSLADESQIYCIAGLLVIQPRKYLSNKLG